MTEAPSIAELLNQEETWFTREGGQVRLADMGDPHIINLLAWLERNAARLQASLTTGGHHGDMAQDAIDSMLAELDGDPLSWMHRQPLYAALTRELAGRTEPAEPPLAVGDVIHGFCNGKFGRDSYEDKRVEAIGPDWVVLRPVDPYYTGLRLYSGDPQDLAGYREPVCVECDFQHAPGPLGECAQCGRPQAGVPQ